MNVIKKYSKFIPYLYFISIIIYWFTSINRSEGLSAYPILLFAIPFLYQLIIPNKKLNFSLGIIFVCLSSYLILAYLANILSIIQWSENAQRILFYSGFIVIGNFTMSLWIIRNSIKKAF